MAFAVSLLFNSEITDVISARWMRLVESRLVKFDA
jgi:hypothetical protein